MHIFIPNPQKIYTTSVSKRFPRGAISKIQNTKKRTINDQNYRQSFILPELPVSRRSPCPASSWASPRHSFPGPSSWRRKRLMPPSAPSSESGVLEWPELSSSSSWRAAWLSPLATRWTSWCQSCDWTLPPVSFAPRAKEKGNLNFSFDFDTEMPVCVV